MAEGRVIPEFFLRRFSFSSSNMLWCPREIKVLRLRNAIQEYDQDRWRLIAAKVGNGFTPAACREKAKELQEP